MTGAVPDYALRLGSLLPVCWGRTELHKLMSPSMGLRLWQYCSLLVLTVAALAVSALGRRTL